MKRKNTHILRRAITLACLERAQTVGQIEAAVNLMHVVLGNFQHEPVPSKATLRRWVREERQSGVGCRK